MIKSAGKMLLFLVTLPAMAQNAPRPVEPGMEDSYDTSEYLVMAAAGMALLIAFYFLVKRRRNKPD